MLNRITQTIVPLLILAALACNGKQTKDRQVAVGKPVFVATIEPIAMLLREIVGDEAEVVCLVSPGTSPHTFEPKPSDMRAVERAAILFSVGPGLDDWAERLPAKRVVRCVDLIPEERRLTFEEETVHGVGEHAHTHAGGTVDPHFWTDPETASFAAAGMFKAIKEHCPEADPKALAGNFGMLAASNATIYEELSELLAPHAGRSVILFHPSFQYLLRRFDIRVAGVIEPSPGKEPSPKQLKELRDIIAREGITTIFTEPQLNPGPARALAEAAGVKLAELDPNGGVPGRETYEELIRYNARILAESFQ